ncbi:Carboxylesterase type B [Actinobacteria bacterium OK074]|nr:Carboxylesterase type B [Actinobacteria bacterium OK074]
MTDRLVDTRAGKVRGTETGEGVVAWRGIPYAAPPVGPLRLRLPVPAEPWSGVRDAAAYGPPSLQPTAMAALAAATPLPGGAPGPPAPAEDCLYLNVTAPEGAERRPVLLWVHGGGYMTGHGAAQYGDCGAFARTHDVVVVTFNYRLGALGFLALGGFGELGGLDGLGAEAHTGSFGLHDQIAALRWVHDNIAGFGGDPDRITVYGMSAGAKSVANLLASPLTRGLIHRAASSSGGADHVATPAQDAEVTRRFLRALGTGPERIREVTAEEILHAQTTVGDGFRAMWLWRPSIDGLALTARPLEAIAAGAAAGVPLLAQTCVNECDLYELFTADAADQTARVLGEYFGAAGRDRILAAYATTGAGTGVGAGVSANTGPAQARLDIMTDERYGIPTTRLADAQSAHAPVWRSRYDGPLTGMPPPIAPTGALPAFHGSDGAGIWLGGAGANAQLHAVWGAFANGGTPSAAGLPSWPGYSTDRRTTMVFDSAGSYVLDDPRGDRRAAWDGLEWDSGTWWPLDGLT